MGYVKSVESIADMQKGRNAIFVERVESGHYQDVKLTFTSK